MNRPFLVTAAFELFISSAVGLSSSSSSIAFASSAFRFLAFCFSASDVLSLRISSAVLLTRDFLPFPLPLLVLTSVSFVISFFFTLVFYGSTGRVAVHFSVLLVRSFICSNVWPPPGYFFPYSCLWVVVCLTLNLSTITCVAVVLLNITSLTYL